MSLNPAIWHGLEQHGLTEEHMAMLLDVLALQRNGSFCLNYVHGQVEQADVRLVVPNRSRETARVAKALVAAVGRR